MKRLLALIGLCWVLTPATPAAAQGMPLQNCKKPGEAIFDAASGNDKEGFLKGTVQITCDDTQIFAEEITWDETTLRARGSLLIVQDGLRVTAESVEMDRKTHLAIFYKAAGTARLTERAIEKSMFGTLEPEVSFNAEKLERLGPRKYRLTDGWFSTCVQANPRWDIRGTSGSVTLDERVILRNALLRVKGIPVLYLPIIYYPLGEDDRSSGFLLPTYTQSAIRGHGFSNAFFWAINLSQDATLYHDYFSKSGQGAGGEYRFISAPGSRGNVSVYMLDERAQTAENGGFARPAHRSYTAKATMNQSLGPHFRAMATVDYFTDVTTLQLYQQDAYDASRRTRYFRGSVTGNYSRLNLSAYAERRDLYTSATTAIRSGRLPHISASMGQPLGRTGFGSRVYFGMNAELTGIQNQTDISQSSTNLGLWRFDVQPTVRAPLFGNVPFMSGTVSSSWRLTHWSESLDPLTGSPRPEPITRPLTEVKVEVTGPTVARVFQTPDSGYALRFKHQIEPGVSLQWLSPFNRFTEVVRNDSAIDCIVGGNTTLNYSLSNVVSARRKQGDGPGRIQQLLRVGISQSYYTKEAAAVCDIQYQTATTAGKFSPVQILTTVTPTDSLSGRLQVFLDSKTMDVQTYSASLSAHSPVSEVQAGWSKRQFLPNVPGFDNPLFANHFLHATAALHRSDRKFGGTYVFRLDVKNRSFLEQRWSAFYNAQCCGISVDYQIYNVAPLTTGLRQDHRFNFSFTLAGIGSFSNPLGSFGR